jgi:hypothetical protein
VNYVASYHQCSISPEKRYLESCWPYLDKVFPIDQVLYPMGSSEPLLSPFIPSNMVFPLEYDLTICETSRLGICVLSRPSFMDFEFPSDEFFLEVMIMDFQPLSELEDLLVGYQRNPWPEPSNRLYLEEYYA